MPPDLTARVGEPSPVPKRPRLYGVVYLNQRNQWEGCYVGTEPPDTAHWPPLAAVLTIPGEDEPRVGVEEVMELVDKWEEAKVDAESWMYHTGEASETKDNRREQARRALESAIRRLAGEKP